MNNTFISRVKMNFNPEKKEQQSRVMKCKRCGSIFQSHENSCPHCRKEGYNIFIAEEVKPQRNQKSVLTRLFSF